MKKSVFDYTLEGLALTSFAEILSSLASEMQAAAGRWGGEEFLVVCYDSNPQAIRALAEDLRARVESTDFPDVGRFTCSIGLTELRPEDTPKSAFERVDKALYQAKESGRNCIRTADA